MNGQDCMSSLILMSGTVEKHNCRAKNSRYIRLCTDLYPLQLGAEKQKPQKQKKGKVRSFLSFQLGFRL